MPYAIGIDLGTTNSCVAVCRGGRSEALQNDHGEYTTPSCLAFTPDSVLIGTDAKDQLQVNPKNTIYDFKRLIGRSFDDPVLQEDMKQWPFTIVQDGVRVKVQVEYGTEVKKFLPEQLCSMLLAELKRTTELRLGEKVNDVVITVPAYFNSAQREATRNAGQIAGLNVLQLLDEPTAAAIAYGFREASSDEQNLLVFDFGGGTLDVSVLSANNKNFTVKATAGDNHLGGEDFDQNLVTCLLNEIRQQFTISVDKEQSIVHRLHEQCEQAKRDLSNVTSTLIEIDCLDQTTIQRKMNRSEFEKLNEELFQRALSKVDQALEDAKISKSRIDHVILVGGSSRIPRIQQLLSKHFGEIELNKSVNPDEIVACGAAVLAASLSKTDDQDDFDIDVVNVVPYSLGWSDYSGQMKVLIPRNSPFPFENVCQTTTVEDNQTRIDYLIYEGEHAMTKDNRFLDQFSLQNIKPARRGNATIDLKFQIDKDGVLLVSATERGHGCQKIIEVTRTHGSLSEEEKNRIAEETEHFRLENEKHRERMVVWNEVEEQSYSLREEAKMKLSSGRISEETYTNIVNKCTEVRLWLQNNQCATKEEYIQKKSELNDLRSTM
ncbi:unnamed protein product [Calicophoron daubneyi]|uniref:Heat shock protein 70 n=1 Tax=Calicophoron daubneyi TaxID=300641 RepID=A0AAV2T3Z4_CALDB